MMITYLLFVCSVEKSNGLQGDLLFVCSIEKSSGLQGEFLRLCLLSTTLSCFSVQ